MQTNNKRGPYKTRPTSTPRGTLRSRPIYREPFDTERFLDALIELAFIEIEKEEAAKKRAIKKAPEEHH